MRPYLILLLLGAVSVLPAQEPAKETRPKDVRDIAKGGSTAIPRLQEFLKNPNVDVRVEAVKQITEIGTQRSSERTGTRAVSTAAVKAATRAGREERESAETQDAK